MDARKVLFGCAFVTVLLVQGIAAQDGIERCCTPMPWDPEYPICNPCFTIFGEYPTTCYTSPDGQSCCTCIPGTVPGWRCKDAHTVGYQDADGSWSQLSTCLYGCSNGQCNTAPGDGCQEGWRCKDSNTRGYRNADCSWSNVETCEGGCFGGTCLGGKNVHRIYRTCSCNAGVCSCSDQDRIFQRCSGGCLNGACVDTPSGEVSVDFAQMLTGGAGTVLAVIGLLLMVI